MASNDRIGDYTLRELLGAAPVSSPPEKKKGPLGKVLGAPFKLAAAIIKLPVTIIRRVVGGLASVVGEIVRLPVRLVRALISPWRKQP